MYNKKIVTKYIHELRVGDSIALSDFGILIEAEIEKIEFIDKYVEITVTNYDGIQPSFIKILPKQVLVFVYESEYSTEIDRY